MTRTLDRVHSCKVRVTLWGGRSAVLLIIGSSWSKILDDGKQGPEGVIGFDRASPGRIGLGRVIENMYWSNYFLSSTCSTSLRT